MRRYQLIGLLLLVTLSLVLTGCFGLFPKSSPVPEPPEEEVEVGTITGYLVDRNGNLLAGATLQIGDTSVTTNAEGAYTLEDIEYGEHTLEISAPGHEPTTRTVRVDSESQWLPLRIGPNTEKNLVWNWDFSHGVQESGVPVGWYNFANNQADGATYVVTDEESLVGGYSFKIVDTTNSKGAGIRTEYFPAEPGQTFRVEVDMLVTQGSSSVWLDFRTENGAERVQSYKAVPTATSTNWETVKDGWKRVFVEGTAPENTSTVTIILYAENTHMTEATYYDNVLFYRVD